MIEDKYNICKNCVITDNFFGARIDDEGLCNFCKDSSYKSAIWSKIQITDSLRKKYLKKWDELIKNLQEKYGNKDYSCLIGYSGGKDSTALMDTFINEYNLKPFFITIDTGFMTKVAKDNIIKTLERMGNVDDHLFISEASPTFLKMYKYFFTHHFTNKTSLTLDICHVCTDLIHTILVKEAVKRNLKYVFIGYSPDQIARYFYKTSKESIIKTGLPRPEEYKNLLLKDDVKWYLDQQINKTALPKVIYPYHVINYDEKEIISRIESKGLINKGKGDPVLTNCHVVKAALNYDFFRYGAITYAVQYAELVRQKEEGIERKKFRKEWLRLISRVARNIINGTFDKEGINIFLKKIDLPQEELRKIIEKALQQDPNKDKIIKNIALFKNRKFK